MVSNKKRQYISFEDIEPTLECQVCMELSMKPIYQCRNGHIYCKPCSPKLKKCPTCQVNINPRDPIRSLVADKLLEMENPTNFDGKLQKTETPSQLSLENINSECDKVWKCQNCTCLNDYGTDNHLGKMCLKSRLKYESLKMFATNDVVKASENVYNGNEAVKGMKNCETTESLNLLSCSGNNEREKLETAILEQGKVAILEGTRLTNDDLQCLGSKAWLIDNVIYFNLKYQRNFYFPEHKNKIEIVSPAVVHVIKLKDGNDISSFLHPYSPWKFPKENPSSILSKLLVIFPVNSAGYEDEGAHWSLLILIPEEKVFYHIDTLGNLNDRDAKTFAYNFLRAIGEEESNYSFYSKYDHNSIAQPNNYDCGLYVLQFARAAEYHFCQNRGTFLDFHPKLRQINSKKARKSILQRIKGIADSTQTNL